MLQGLSLLFARPEIWVGALSLAAFLTIYWTLRGAPPGQAVRAYEEPSAPAPGRRDVMIAGVAAGLVLILIASYILFNHGVVWSLPVFAIGIGLVLWLNVLSHPFRHASPVLRRSAELSNLMLNAILVAGILIAANVVAFRYGGQGIDLTREKTFSLSSLSLNQIKSLDRPVAFRLVYGNGPRAIRQLERVVQLLELYREANPDRIRIETLNPNQELTQTENPTRKAPDLAILRGGGVVVEYGEGSDVQSAVVPSPEMFEALPPDVSLRGADRFESVFKGEDAITSAIIRLREGQKSKVAFTTGHGEPSTGDLNPGGYGIGLWKSRLVSVGCDVSELNLIKDEIPDDLALLIVVGPKTPFKPDEINRLKHYSDKGGPLLLLLGNTDSSGLDDFLQNFNLEIGPGLLVDPQMNFNRDARLVFAMLKANQTHLITESIQSDRAVLIPNGAPIRVMGIAATAPSAKPKSPVNPNLVPMVVLRSGPQSWVESDLTNPRLKQDPESDEQGPVIIGVAVQEKEKQQENQATSDGETKGPKPRLVLFSSPSIADNVLQGIEPTNLDLLMNTVSWLRGRPNAVGISPHTHVALTLTADPMLRNRLVLVPTVFAVLTIISAGLIVYLARRE